jgi:Immunity protein 74
MPIAYMTPGHIDFQFGERSVTLQGEALNPSSGGVDYVIYGFSIDRWNAPKDDQVLTPAERKLVLETVLRELRAKGTVVEVEGSDEAAATSAAVRESVRGGLQCPDTGFWTTGSRIKSRRYFFQGEAFPDFESQFGLVVWHWDPDQDSPEQAT